MTDYRRLAAAPDYVQAEFGPRGNVINAGGDKPVWSGKVPPPAIGTQIMVTMNQLGPGIVRGYFVETGFLGLLVEFSEPPPWWLKQNGANRDKLGHIFGIEFKQVLS